MQNASVPELSKSASSQRIIWLVALTLVLFLIWSSLASLDQIVRGSGKIVPASNTQVIQSLEGGILSELLVKEGDIVEKSQVLGRLNDKRFKGAFEELEAQVVALEAKLMRLSSEIEQKDELVLPQSIWEKAPDIAASETQLFNAKYNEFNTARKALRSALELHQREVKILKSSVKRRVAPEIDLVNSMQEESDVRSKLSALESDYSLSRTEEYATTLTELNQARATLETRSDQLERTVLTAPTRGIVNKVLITTIGGVAPPGEPILELTPLDDELRIEAEILPRDVAFVFPNMDATVKLSAYDYTIYGSFSGKVTHVSADTFEKQTGRDTEPYYKVFITLDPGSISNASTDIEIRPGMLADTELHAGNQTVLRYLLKPLFKASEAFREP